MMAPKDNYNLQLNKLLAVHAHVVTVYRRRGVLCLPLLAPQLLKRLVLLSVLEPVRMETYIQFTGDRN
jgi:hypothetical protein